MKSFICRRCGACCRQPGFVYLHEEDVERLAGYLSMDVYDFTDRYCLLTDRIHLSLKKKSDETCLFLESKGCSVYSARPQQCRDFPIKWKTEKSLSYCEGLNR